MAASPDWLKDEVRRELNTLQQSHSLSQEAFHHCSETLEHEWGPAKNPPGTAGGSPDQLFVELDNHLRELVQQKALGEGALGSIYVCISQERAGKPVIGVPVQQAAQGQPPPPAAQKSARPGKDWHLGQKSANAGKLVMSYAVRGFGWTLGADAANDLVHNVF